MVARITTGTSIGGVLEYNEKKLEQSVASLLYAGGFPRAAENLSLKSKLAVFHNLTSQNIRTKTNTMHVTLNFSPQDQLNKDKLTQIARDYMEGIGFGAQPFLVYQHFDAAHPHIHIATVTIADGGLRIPTHNIGCILSSKVRREIETTYGLTRVEDAQLQEIRQKEKGNRPPVRLERVIYGKVGTKDAIFSIVGEVVKSYKFCSLTELNAVLNQFGVMVDGGRPGSRMHQNGGLIYALLDENNKRIGSAINASLVEGRPTLKNLQKRYMINSTSRRPYGQRLRYLLDKALSGSSSKQGLEQLLRKHGVRVVFNKNAQGALQDVHFIDNATRVVYKGEDLGGKYSASQFLAAVSRKADLELSSSSRSSFSLNSSLKSASKFTLEPIDRLLEPSGIVPATSKSATLQPTKSKQGALVTGNSGGTARAGMAAEAASAEYTEFTESTESHQREQRNAISGDVVEREKVGGNAPRIPGSELPVIQILTDCLYYDDKEEKSGLAAEKKQGRQASFKISQQMGL